MARQLNAGEDMKRTDLIHVDPHQIIVKEEERGRRYPPTDDDIAKLAVDMVNAGQLQPVKCRVMPDKRLMLMFGFTRVNAARLIRAGFEYGGQSYKDETFKIQTTITDANEKEAFLSNISENRLRNETSPIDDAFNQRRCRDQFGMDNAAIAKEYCYGDVNRVARLQLLLNLPENIQMLIHHGQLPVQAAVDILNNVTDEQQRKEMFDKILVDASTNGGVNGSEIRTLVRDKLLNDNETATETTESVSSTPRKKTPKGLSRGMRDVRKFFEAIIADEESKEELKTFSKVALLWVKGTRNDKFLLAALNTLADG